jgi:hypothetical protein
MYSKCDRNPLKGKAYNIGSKSVVDDTAMFYSTSKSRLGKCDPFVARWRRR